MILSPRKDYNRSDPGCESVRNLAGQEQRSAKGNNVVDRRCRRPGKASCPDWAKNEGHANQADKEILFRMPHEQAQRSWSSTSRTLRTSASGVNGFCKKALPGERR